MRSRILFCPSKDKTKFQTNLFNVLLTREASKWISFDSQKSINIAYLNLQPLELIFIKTGLCYIYKLLHADNSAKNLLPPCYALLPETRCWSLKRRFLKPRFESVYFPITWCFCLESASSWNSLFIFTRLVSPESWPYRFLLCTVGACFESIIHMLCTRP